jgi:Cu-processing system permease protein
MKKIIKYVMADILRSRILIGYTLFLLVIALSVFSLEDDPAKGLLSLLNIVLIIVPLVSIIFSTIYVYNASEFIELVVSQPLKRKTLWISIFTGLSASLVLAFLAGVGVPVMIYDGSSTGLTMVLVGAGLSVIFVAIALLAAVRTRDKAKGIGVAILLWFYFSIIYDGLILFLLFQFSDYPMEKATIVFSSFNPIDLGRILILLKLDISALMGYTGAVFKDFFGGGWGRFYAATTLLAWAVLPLLLSLRKFKRKDL